MTQPEEVPPVLDEKAIELNRKTLDLAKESLRMAQEKLSRTEKEADECVAEAGSKERMGVDHRLSEAQKIKKRAEESVNLNEEKLAKLLRGEKLESKKAPPNLSAPLDSGDNSGRPKKLLLYATGFSVLIFILVVIVFNFFSSTKKVDEQKVTQGAVAPQQVAEGKITKKEPIQVQDVLLSSEQLQQISLAVKDGVAAGIPLGVAAVPCDRCKNEHKKITGSGKHKKHKAKAKPKHKNVPAPVVASLPAVTVVDTSKPSQVEKKETEAVTIVTVPDSIKIKTLWKCDWTNTRTKVNYPFTGVTSEDCLTKMNSFVTEQGFNSIQVVSNNEQKLNSHTYGRIPTVVNGHTCTVTDSGGVEILADFLNSSRNPKGLVVQKGYECELEQKNFILNNS